MSQTGESDEVRHQTQTRVIYSLLMPAVRLGLLFGFPLKEMGDLLQMAFYHEAKQQGLKMREISDRLGVSMRKVAQLSKRLKRNFLQPESDYGLPRRIEFMLWAEPLSELRIGQALPAADPDAIEAALEQLLEQGRITRVEGRTVTYAVVRSEARLVERGWLARIDGLNNVMGTVTNTVYARLFDNDPASFARTLSLRVRAQDVPQLQALYHEVIYPSLRTLEEQTQGDDGDVQQMDVSLLWSPVDYVDGALKRDLKEKDRDEDDNTK